MRLFITLAFLLTSLAHAQTWQKVAKDGDSVTFGTLPVTLRYGTPQGTTVTLPGAKPCATVGGCWNATVTIPVGGVVSLTVAPSPTLGTTDPAYGTVKELDVLETAVAQVVTVNGTKVTIPTLPPPKYTVTCTAPNIPNPPNPSVSYPATCTVK